MKLWQSYRNQQLRLELLKFCVVGGAGFLVDVGFLQICLPALGAIASRAISFLLAVLTTHELNRRFVFVSSGSASYLRRLGIYLAVQGSEFVLNFVVYVVLLMFLLNPYNQPLFCLAVASICALGFNFVGAKRVVFQ